MDKRMHGLPLLGFVLAHSVAACAARAQSLESATPEAALQCFEDSRVAGKTVSDCPGTIPAEGIVNSPVSFPSATVVAVADGLEELALTSRDWRVRFEAALWLSKLGESDPKRGRPVPGTVDRLAALFSQTPDSNVRHAIVTTMPPQADRSAAISFLMDAATQDFPIERKSDWPSAARAIEILNGDGSGGHWGSTSTRC